MKLPKGIDFCDTCGTIRPVRQEGRDTFCAKCGGKIKSRKSKFNNRITYVDAGDDAFCRCCQTALRPLKFDSAKEARRFFTLARELEAGAIQNLRLQEPFDIWVNGHKICTYVADFVYAREGKEVVEDTKGHRTPEYKLKRALMLAVLGITICET